MDILGWKKIDANTPRDTRIELFVSFGAPDAAGPALTIEGEIIEFRGKTHHMCFGSHLDTMEKMHSIFPDWDCTFTHWREIA